MFETRGCVIVLQRKHFMACLALLKVHMDWWIHPSSLHGCFYYTKADCTAKTSNLLSVSCAPDWDISVLGLLFWNKADHTIWMIKPDIQKYPQNKLISTSFVLITSGLYLMPCQNGWLLSYPSWLGRRKARVTDSSYCRLPECATTFSLTQQHSWQLWSPAVADKQRSRSADQLSLKWQATAESIHLEAPGDSTLPTTTTTTTTFLTKFFQRRRNGVTVATRAGKVKRVSLEMLLRKSAKQLWIGTFSGLVYESVSMGYH